MTTPIARSSTASSFAATLAAWPTELVTFANLTVDLRARTLFISGRAPIALGADQARVLELLIQGHEGFVDVGRIERDTVNRAETTVDSLNTLLRSAGALVAIVHDLRLGYQLVAEGSLSFADLSLNHVSRLMLVSGHKAILLSRQNAAVLKLLLQARGGPVTGRELERVCGRTAAGAAIGNLSRRLRGSGTIVTILNERSRGWRLFATERSPSTICH